MKAIRFILILSAVFIGISLSASASFADVEEFLTSIDSHEDFVAISSPWTDPAYPQVEWITKYLAPTANVAGAPDYTVFINVKHPIFEPPNAPTHWHFLALATNPDLPGSVFRPEIDVANPWDTYFPLVLYRDSPAREYFDGSLFEIHSGDEVFYGFDILTAPGELGELLEEHEVEEAYSQLISHMGFTVDLRYAPFYEPAREKARTYAGGSFPVYFFPDEPDVEYAGYSLNANYGRVRLYDTLANLLAALADNQVSWQDIVVVNEAPVDIETVIAGLITERPQAPGSHFYVRAMVRGTPNAYLNNALTELAPYEGQLVRLEVRADGYTIEPASEEDAEAWWAGHRSRVEIPPPDDAYTYVLRCNDPAFDFNECAVERFGGKGSNLARLYQIIPRHNQSEAVFIPFSYYTYFINNYTIYLDLTDPYYDVFREPGDYTSRCTYREYIDNFLGDERFNTDRGFRNDVLWYLREYMKDNRYALPVSFIQPIKDAIAAEFDIDFSRVQPSDYLRFRSSSNAEDSLEFSGAGLYDSIGIFNGNSERSWPDGAIMKGLNKVWRSLWTLRAVEERMYYQIDQSKVRMGVLVTRGYSEDVGNEELANGVTFTHDPSYYGEGYAYQINVQLGDAEVANPARPGDRPEIDRIIVVDDTIVGIERIQQAILDDSLIPWILSDDQLLELGSAMLLAENGLLNPESDYAFDLQGWAPEQVALDFEFKIRPDSSLLVKQVRPYLKPLPREGVYIPANASVSGIFKKDRTLDTEHEIKAKIYLKAAILELPRNKAIFTADLIERIEFIEDTYPPTVREILPIAGEPGIFIMSIETVDTVTYYNYTYRQRFFDGDEGFYVIIDNICLSDDLGIEFINLDSAGLYNLVITDTQGRVYSPWDYKELEENVIDIPLTNGLRFILHERKQGGFYIGTVPAYLSRAEIFDQRSFGLLQDVTDYWSLIYAASLHNKEPIYRFYFEPIEIQGEFIVGIKYLPAEEPIFGITADRRYIPFEIGVYSEPIALDQQVLLDEDASADIVLQAVDLNGDPLSYEIVSLPAHGTISGEAPYLIYIPAFNYYGEDSFTFRAFDGTYYSNIATVNITVNSVNDPPVASAIPDQVAFLREEFARINLDDYVDDVDNPDVEIMWIAPGGDTNFRIYITNRVATIFILNRHWTGSETRTFVAIDPDGESDSTEVTLTVVRNSRDIQDEIDSAIPGEEILIQPGTYLFTSNLNIIKDITLTPDDGNPDYSNPDETVLILGDYHIFVKEPLYPPGRSAGRITDVTIEGVTITGYTGRNENGPIQNYALNLSLKNCKIVDNEGTKVSAIYNYWNSTLNLDNTLVARNKNYPQVTQTGYGLLTGHTHCGAIYLDGRARLDKAYKTTIADNTNETDSFVIQTGYGETGYGSLEVPINYGAIQRYLLNYIEITDSILWNNEGGKDISQRYTMFQDRDIANTDIEQRSVIGEGTFDTIHIDPKFDINYVPGNPNPRLSSMGARFE